MAALSSFWSSHMTRFLSTLLFIFKCDVFLSYSCVLYTPWSEIYVFCTVWRELAWKSPSHPTSVSKVGKPQGCPCVSMILSCCRSLLFSEHARSCLCFCIFIHAFPTPWDASYNYWFLFPAPPSFPDKLLKS